jgi:FkbM family methyltransferase
MARHFRQMLSWSSRLRYLQWRLTGARRTIWVTTNAGDRLRLRPWQSRDYGTAYEVFVLEVYRPPFVDIDCRTIVDLGANVGFSSLYFARRFPSAEIHAFEPHPVHCGLLDEIVRANGLTGRVRIVPAAAGVADRRVFLTDENRESHVLDAGGANAVPVVMLDIFSRLKALGSIDLMKIDIEGSEYPILRDRRFASLDVRQLVMEWHRTPEKTEGRAWCIKRLESLGYSVEERENADGYGTIAAHRLPRLSATAGKTT